MQCSRQGRLARNGELHEARGREAGSRRRQVARAPQRLLALRLMVSASS